MAKPPSLVNLCISDLTNYIIYEEDVEGIIQGIYELPTELFDCFLHQLPPLALLKLQLLMPSEKQGEFIEYSSSGDGRKRVRYGKFDMAWKALYHLRWPELAEHREVTLFAKETASEYEAIYDWQQKYWETHLQNCFDAVAERAMLPSFNKCIGEVEIPDVLVKAIGHREQTKCSNLDYSRFQSHCQAFGCYVRSLKLQNVFCNAETFLLLAKSKLKQLILRRICSQMHVDGLCMILNQHKSTLKSLEFVNCKISLASFEAICQSICMEDIEMHGIKDFAVRSSKFLEANLTSLPPKLVAFISSRSLESLSFCESHIRNHFAKLTLMALLEASSALSSLELSDNNISGWLSDFQCKSSNQGLSSQQIGKSLKSLSVLSLRGTNLRKSDVEDLECALAHMPVLKTLDLSDNPLEDDGVKSLIPYFVKTMEQFPLSNLILKNCKLSCSGATDILEVLLALSYPISSLSLADNDLGSQIAHALGDFLSSSVRHLDIRDIGLGSSGFLELQISSPDLVNLISIDLSENRGGIQAAEFLQCLISRAPELLVVHAGYNLMPPESLNLICSALKIEKGKLQRIDLMGNHKLCQADHACLLADIQHNCEPIVLIPAVASQDAPYDDDP